jgi:hypothetical protein
MHKEELSKLNEKIKLLDTLASDAILQNNSKFIIVEAGEKINQSLQYLKFLN